MTFPVTISYDTEPSDVGTISSTQVTVIDCAVFQFTVVNVTVAGTVHSSVFEEVRSIVTSFVGCDVRTMLKLPVPLLSEVKISRGVTVTPNVSSSTSVATTVESASASNPSFERASFTRIVIVLVGFTGLSTELFTQVTVTDCGVFQFAEVNVRLLGLAVAPVLEVISRTTFDVGSTLKRTVNIPLPPFSWTESVPVDVTIPAVSLSVISTLIDERSSGE